MVARQYTACTDTFGSHSGDQKMRPRHDRYSWQGQPTHVVRYVYPLKKRAHFVYNSATISYLDIATSQQETNGHCKSSAARLGSARRHKQLPLFPLIQRGVM